MRLCLTLSAIAMLGLSSAFADGDHGIVGAFVQTCVQTLPAPSRIRAMAQAGNWTSVDGDLGVVLGPPLATSAKRIWLVKKPDPDSFFVGIGGGTLNGKRTVACSVSNPTAPNEAVVASLTAAMELSAPISDRQFASERMRVWIGTTGIKSVYVMMADTGPAHEPGVTLTVMAPQL